VPPGTRPDGTAVAAHFMRWMRFTRLVLVRLRAPNISTTPTRASRAAIAPRPWSSDPVSARAVAPPDPSSVTAPVAATMVPVPTGTRVVGATARLVRAVGPVGVVVVVTEPDVAVGPATLIALRANLMGSAIATGNWAPDAIPSAPEVVGSAAVEPEPAAGAVAVESEMLASPSTLTALPLAVTGTAAATGA
jgi:hypothetical protein